LIPTLNEENFIEDCIYSLINGNYPNKLIELIVIDGGSTDQTLDRIAKLDKGQCSIKCIHNDKKIVPSAINMGGASASNDVILLAGAHAIYHEDYILYSVETLISEQCASVGGVITPIAKTPKGKAIALATSSKFGIGNAKYRYAKDKQSVDTVFAGCFLKSSIDEIGGFNEKWVRNQDYEFNFRLRAQVGKIILDPRIKCQYYCRETITSLSNQYRDYGYWRFYTSLRHPSSFTIRQAIPNLLLLGLFISLVITLCGSWLGIVLPLIYLCANIAASIQLCFERNDYQHLMLFVIIFTTLHLSWALGFFKGALTWLKTKLLNTC